MKLPVGPPELLRERATPAFPLSEIVLPATRLPDVAGPLRPTPSNPLSEIVLPAPDVVPPIVLSVAPPRI